jgi:hypothetical protein
MSVNQLTVNQAATVFNEIVHQATGQTNLKVTDTSSFVSAATTVLLTGYDKLLSAMSQVLTRTIFSIRPYNAKFAGLRASPERFGNHTRKVNYLDDDFEDSPAFELQQGKSIDMYTVNKPRVVQTNFYGFNTYAKHKTFYDNQLDMALRNPEEWAQFFNGVMVNINSQIEQVHENVARATIANFIGGINVANQSCVVHLLTEYNELTGQTLTVNDIYKSDNFIAFVRWLYARIEVFSNRLTERTQLWHVNIVGNEVKRHTPKNKQKVYLFNDFMSQARTMVLSDLFQRDSMKMVDYEGVNFWQAIDSPDSIDVTPVYTNAEDGTLVTGVEQKINKVLGVIFDEEAMGFIPKNQAMGATPHNVAGRYTNLWWHWDECYYNDFTENGIVLLLD